MDTKLYVLALIAIGFFALVVGPILAFVLVGSDPALFLEIGGGIITITVTLSMAMVVLIGAVMSTILRKKTQ